MNLTADWLYWLILLSVCAVNIALVYIAWWALFSDRNKGMRRCPRCWHNLEYSPGMTCGECGFTAGSERQFHVTRRRYKVAAAAIFSSVLLTGLVSEHLSQRGWVSRMPTRLLLMTLPLTKDFNGTIGREIVSRANSAEMSDSQWMKLLERCAEGDWGARPVSDAWVDKYGWFIGSQRRALRGDAALEGVLKSIEPRLDVRVPPVWPVELHPTAMIQLRDWWPWGTECRVSATAKMLDAQGNVIAENPPLTVYRTGDDRVYRRDYPLPLPAVTPDARSVSIEFEIDRRPMFNPTPGDSSPAPPWEPVMTRSVDLPIRAQQPTDKRLEGVDSLAMSEAIARVFADSPVRFPARRSPVRFRIAMAATDNATFDDVAVGLSAELYCGEVLARRLDLWWLGGLVTSDRNYGFKIEYEHPELASISLADDPGPWTMVIRGQRDIALRAGAGTKFWDGELTLPVEIAQSNSPAPRRAWWTEDEPSNGE